MIKKWLNDFPQAVCGILMASAVLKSVFSHKLKSRKERRRLDLSPLFASQKIVS